MSFVARGFVRTINPRRYVTGLLFVLQQDVRFLRLSAASIALSLHRSASIRCLVRPMGSVSGLPAPMPGLLSFVGMIPSTSQADGQPRMSVAAACSTRAMLHTPAIASGHRAMSDALSCPQESHKSHEHSVFFFCCLLFLFCWFRHVCVGYARNVYPLHEFLCHSLDECDGFLTRGVV